MSMEKQKRGQIGVNTVERIVLRDWEGRWQPIDSVNDDGVDGLIFIESRGTPTGQIIFVQIKCTNAKPNTRGEIAIPIARKKLEMNFERWRRVVGAAILIHVNPKNFEAHWVDLRGTGAVGNTQVFVPVANAFNKAARKHISSLCGTIHRDLLMIQVKTTSDDFSYLTSKDHLQTAARQYYRKLEASAVKLGGSGPTVSFTKEGWRHLTRFGRSRLTQLQSFQLLGAARSMIESIPETELREVNPKKGNPVEFVYMVAAVSFPHRQTAVVKILLWRRTHPVEGINYSFRTVYEPRRRRDIIGIRKVPLK